VSNRAVLRQHVREWLVALLSYGLLVAPFGCQFQALLDNSGGSTLGGADTSATGLFLNDDANSPVLVAARTAAGDAFFVYGTRGSSGGVDGTRVESVLVQTADGRRAFMTFEQGRPVHLEGPDGSYIHVTYEEVSADRLDATITAYDANTGQQMTGQVSVDLQQVRENLQQFAQQGAEQLSRLLGQTVQVPAATTLTSGKMQERAVSAILAALVVLPLTVLVQFCFYIVGETLTALRNALAASLQASFEATVRAACFPLIVFSNALQETSWQVRVVPLFRVFVQIPDPPRITIRF
jgi:hypothetical protein